MMQKEFNTRAEALSFYKKQRQATLRDLPNGRAIVFVPSEAALGHPSSAR